MRSPDPRLHPTIGLMLLAAVACSVAPEPTPPARALEATTPAGLPLSEPVIQSYFGFPGGLYPGGMMVPPRGHDSVGMDRASAIKPLTTNGLPGPGGRVVLLSIGMSNTTQEFCGSPTGGACNPWTFAGQAARDTAVRATALVDGAAGGQTADLWEHPTQPNYQRVRTLLATRGLTERQVQVIWLKVADGHPTISLPSPGADAYVLLTRLGNILRTLHVVYPNLQQVFLSSRIYGGYATITTNPEPYAYESGFAARWLIEAQIRESQGGALDPRAGDVRYSTVPWVAWGPYLWARGLQPRTDGLVWAPADFETDGTHPSQSGETKVGTLLLNFFKSSRYTACWFLKRRSCGAPAAGLPIGGAGTGHSLVSPAPRKT